MASIGIDHIAIPTADAERLILFYKKLGFTINDEKEWREGKVNIFNIQVGDSKINVHPEGYISDYRGPTAVPGCGDVCFVWNGTVDECVKLFEVLVKEKARDKGDRYLQLAYTQGIRMTICLNG